MMVFQFKNQKYCFENCRIIVLILYFFMKNQIIETINRKEELFELK
jgi:hypothetical protein